MINMNFFRVTLQPLSAFILALAVLALPNLAEAQGETSQGIGFYISRAFILVLLLASLVGAVGFGVVASLRDVRKIPYKRQMWRAYGVSLVVWAVLAYVTPAISYAIDSQFRSDVGIDFWGLFISYATVGSIGFLGVRLFFGGKHKPPKSEDKITEDGFVATEDAGHILFEDATTTALFFFMWPAGGYYPTHGRIIEITSEKFTVSSIHKVIKIDWRGPQFKEWYKSGEWAKDAKVYDPAKIEAIRMVTEVRIEPAHGQSYPPFQVIVMDYGRKHIELNYQFKPRIGHMTNEQEEIIRLTKLIAETLRKHRDKPQMTSEDLGLKVNFEGVSDDVATKMRHAADDMVNKIIGEDSQPKKTLPRHDDPF